MSRKEFIDKLEGLLLDIPAGEREEALQYYTDYFEDAGEENIERAIKELGSPEKVAATIKADLKGSSDSGEFSETGYSDTRFEKRENPATREQAYQKEENAYSYTAGAQDRGQPKTNSAARIVLIVLIAIIAIPIAIPVFVGGAGLIIGLVCAAFGLLLGLVVGSIGIMFAGIGLFILGMTKLLVALPSALLTSGSGLILFILGLAATVATVKLCLVVCPAMCRGIVNICRWPFHRREVS